MTALSIQPAYPIFTDTAGQPLDNGYIWIGTVNLAPQTNPISIYWDAALTQTAVQPLRTSGGYIVNSGTPAVIYADSDYSILVQNSKGSAVYSSLAATDRFSGVVVKIDASDVDYTAPGTGAVTTTVQAYLQQVVNVTDFGADPTGFVPCDTAFAAAVTYAKTLSAPELVINAGAYTATGSLTFDLPNYSTITFLGVITSNVVSDAAVRIGSTATNTFGLSVRGVKVQRSANDTSGGSSGVQLRNLSASYVDIRLCTGFQDGVFCYGDKPNGGFSYNEVHMGFIHDNKRNVYLNAGTTGYCNENNFYGGSFNHSSLYPAVATTNLEIANYAPATLNNNRFYGPSFEDNSVLAVAAIINGSNNLIFQPRMENPANQAGYQIQFTVNAIECRVMGHGFAMESTNISDLGTGSVYETREGAVLRFQTPATAGKAVLKLQGYNTSAATVLSVLDSGGVETAKITGVGEAKFTGTTRALAIYNTSGFETAYVTGAGDAVFNSVNTSIPSPTGNFVLVTASSKVLVGGPTSATFAGGVQIYGDATTAAPSALVRGYSNTTAGAALYLVKTRGTTATSTTAVQSGDILGAVVFLGADGTSNQAFAAVTGYCDGAVSAGVVPTALTFTTGTSSGIQRVVITSAGLMGIGTGTPASCAIVDVTSTTLGFKFPVMTTTQKNAIGTPVAGLVVFDSTLAKLCVYSGAAWQTITSV